MISALFFHFVIISFFNPVHWRNTEANRLNKFMVLEKKITVFLISSNKLKISMRKWALLLILVGN